MKRKSIENVNNINNKTTCQEQRHADCVVMSKVWEHFCSFLDSQVENDEGPDFDYLHEIIHELRNFDIPVLLNDVTIESISNIADEQLMNLVFPDLPSLLPVLLSVSYLHLANEVMSYPSISNDDTAVHTPESLLCMSLRYFPFNAAALYELANYRRMISINPQRDICAHYELASKFGHKIREIAINHLQGSNDDDDDNHEEENELSEWIDGLLLHEIVGVRSLDEDTDGENSSNDIEKDEFPGSSIEALSLFMAALLRSSMQDHDIALEHMQKLDLTHRIHPNVWKASSSNLLVNGHLANTLPDSDEEIAFVPQVYTNRVISKDMHAKLLQVFSPKSPFWKESDYHHRSYFSFFEDISKESLVQPRHLIDDLVLNSLLPLVKTVIKDDIVGYEFWVHSRPLNANLGHQLHFDTDESLLNQNKKVTHPVVSSVLYLSGCNDSETSAGSTIIFNQTPDSSCVATKVWLNKPKEDGIYLTFPGNLLHGVLPCTCKDSDRDKSEPIERLTLMVGFWTRRVPETMKNRQLYGPCSPLPPKNDDHTWVHQITEGYPKNSDSRFTRNITSSNVPCISPAWEQIHPNADALQLDDIPIGLDHKYFVKNAPNCFRDCLFPQRSDSNE